MSEQATAATDRRRPDRRFAGGTPGESPSAAGSFAGSAPIVLPERARPRPAPSRAELEQLGRRTAGVAHDFNNLLSVIMVCAGEIAAGADAVQRERAEEIRAAAQRGAELSRGLLASEPAEDATTPEPLAVEHAVLASIKLIDRALGPGIQLSFASDGSLPRVGIGAGDLERVLLNLAANARDAMADGGAVAIGAGVVSVPPGDNRLDTGWHVRITFADNGTGMSPDVAGRALEPYFSTKDDGGGGTGLGLAGARAMVSAAGGDLRINSRPGGGTTISIYLPALDSDGRSLALPDSAA